MAPSAYPAWNRPSDPFIELISAATLADRVAELGRAITADYVAAGATEDVVVLGVLKGSVLFIHDP